MGIESLDQDPDDDDFVLCKVGEFYAPDKPKEPGPWESTGIKVDPEKGQ